MDFLTLKKNLKKDFSGFPGYRMALLSDAAPQFLAQALRGIAYEFHIDLQLLEFPVGSAGPQVFSPASDLYAFKPESVLLYHALPVLESGFYIKSAEERPFFADSYIKELVQQLEMLQSRGVRQVLTNTFPLLTDKVFGSGGNKIPHAFRYQLNRINQELLALAQHHQSLHLIDLESTALQMGFERYFDANLYYASSADLSFEALPQVAGAVLQSLSLQQGRVKKCVITDLDNTLWGGILGDDGPEKIEIGLLGRGKVFTDLQKWLLELKKRGILLAVCSKNEPSLVQQVFATHPDMVLKVSDFVAIKANWNPKNETIAELLSELNIGSASVVFLDDNPAERELVAAFFPEMEVPDLPHDPASWLLYLQKCALFGTAEITEEDLSRTEKYQAERIRKDLANTYANANDYLQDLRMVANIEPATPFSMPRIAQLLQRTNQFNLRTVRYSETELEQFLAAGHLVYSVSLQDKFGSEGIVSAVLLKVEEHTLFIENWVMSCRVFGRGLENLIFNELLKIATGQHKNLRAEYLLTSQNKYVAALLENMGFVLQNGSWYLQLQQASEKTHYITLQ